MYTRDGCFQPTPNHQPSIKATSTGACAASDRERSIDVGKAMTSQTAQAIIGRWTLTLVISISASAGCAWVCVCVVQWW